MSGLTSFKFKVNLGVNSTGSLISVYFFSKLGKLCGSWSRDIGFGIYPNGLGILGWWNQTAMTKGVPEAPIGKAVLLWSGNDLGMNIKEYLLAMGFEEFVPESTIGQTVMDEL